MGGSYGYYSYLTGNTGYLTDPSTFTVSVANLTASTGYKLQLQIYYYSYTYDTSGNPYYDDSVAYCNFQEPSISNTIIVQATSAGTYVNGGGFLSAVSDTKYLQVSDGSDGGALSSLTYGAKIKGNLNLVDGTVFSDTSRTVGYAPAIKAFGSLRYTGASGVGAQMTNINYYTIDGAYGVTSNAIASINTTHAAFQMTFTPALDTTNYEFIFTSSNIDYTSGARTNTPMILSKQNGYVVFRLMATNNTAKYPGEGYSGGFLDFVVIGK
jgi:hypothetical protein